MDASRGFVLVIDEDVQVRETTAQWFEEQGYRVAVADGKAGFQLALRDRPDVILLDAEMPSRVGYETLERLKFDAATRDIPVVVYNSKQPQRDFRIRATNLLGIVERSMRTHRMRSV